VYDCKIPYIPSKLHWNGRPIIKEFYLEEELYWRCKPETDLPYQEISLIDISHNRQGSIKNIISDSIDVLWNIDENKSFEKYEYDIIVLKIKELLPNNTFVNEFEMDGIHISMNLLHEPINCNYSHTIFKFIYQNSVEVTFENYKETLGHKKAKKVRSLCKLKLQAMILRRELRLSY
jgi:hypothetical protein